MTAKSRKYLGAAIELSGYRRCLDNGKSLPLYRLTGAVEKDPEVTPFISSIRAAREYIADVVETREARL